MDVTTAPASARCPRCGATAAMLPILFGFPTHESFEAADRGEVALGGCVVTGEDPTHRCAACDQDVILESEPVELCASCGRPLLGVLEVDARDAGGPICGKCDRARNFDAFEELELADDQANV